MVCCVKLCMIYVIFNYASGAPNQRAIALYAVMKGLVFHANSSTVYMIHCLDNSAGIFHSGISFVYHMQRMLLS